MTNTERRIRYLMASDPGLTLEQARAAVVIAYAGGESDKTMGLTPAQCSRIRHKRSTAPGQSRYARRRRARKLRVMRRMALFGR